MNSDSNRTQYYLIFGEGNGNPLQYFCLENPVDGRAWCRERLRAGGEGDNRG